MSRFTWLNHFQDLSLKTRLLWSPVATVPGEAGILTLHTSTRSNDQIIFDFDDHIWWWSLNDSLHNSELKTDLCSWRYMIYTGGLLRGGRLIIMSGTEQMEWHQTHGNHIPRQPLPWTHPPQLRCHQPPVICMIILHYLPIFEVSHGNIPWHNQFTCNSLFS